MKVVILSAGQGGRLLPYTQDRPKCLVPVAGRPILEWQLESLARAGISDAVIVTGFEAQAVDAFLSRHAWDGMNVRTIFNPFFSVSDNLGSLYMAREELRGGCMVLNGDTLFEPAIVTRLLGKARAPVTVTIDRKARYDDDDMKVRLNGHTLVEISKVVAAGTIDGESIGMLHFDAAGAQAMDDAMHTVLQQSEGVRKWYLSAIDHLARQGSGTVDTVSIKGLAWDEIDCPADLHRLDAGSGLFSWLTEDEATCRVVPSRLA